MKGQHLFCISLSAKQLEEIAKQTIFIKPYVYYFGVNRSTSKTPHLKALGDDAPLTNNVFNYVNFTLGSNEFRGIFKSAKHRSSIFGDMGEGGGIPEMLQSSIIVESFQGDNGSYCPRHSYLKKLTHITRGHTRQY